MTKKRLLFVGWDSADWKIINPIMDSHVSSRSCFATDNVNLASDPGDALRVPQAKQLDLPTWTLV